MRNFELIPQFIFRTPLLPWNTIQDFIRIKEKKEQEAFLKNIFSDEIVREAIFIASPGLLSSIEAWVNGKVKEEDKNGKLVQSMVKYLLRMGTRCTPFGMFAGVSHGTWGTKSGITIGEKEQNHRFVGLDVEYVFNVKETILHQQKDIIRYLTIYPNTTLYQLLDKYKFIDYHYKGDRRKFSVSVVSHTDYLEQVLEKAKNGATFSDLIIILSAFDVSEDEAEQYVFSLLEKQILVTDIEPVLTSGYYFDALLSKLESIEKQTTLHEDIKRIIDECRFIDSNLKALRSLGPVDFISLYERIKFKDLIPKYAASKYFQTDLIKPAIKADLEMNIAAAIRKGLEVMNKLSTASAEENLIAFRDKFRDKYESKAVPLLEALDPETGIAYVGANAIRDVNPLIDDVTFTPPSNNFRKISSFEWSRKDSILLAKLLESRKTGDYSVEITDKDIADLIPNWEDVPDSINVVTSLVHSDDAASGLAVQIIGAGLSGGTNILSRFSHLSPELEALGNRIIDHERSINPDVCLLDLVHLPDYSRIGNILQRSVSHQHELLFLAGTLKNRDYTVDLSDLYLCIQNNRFVLFSKKLNKEVSVRLITAHNYAVDTHPAYHFLGDLQFQGLHWPLQFTWGPVERVYRFLPRVYYRTDKINVIINPASWLYDKKEYKYLLDAKGDAKINLLKAFRLKWQIPDLVVFSEYDHDILIDFENELCREIFFQLLSQKENIKLKEFLKPADSIAIEDVNGLTYTNEVVALFSRKEAKNRIPTVFPILNDRVKRSFPIGSEWLYFKFYVGTKGADDLLSGPVKMITDQLLASQMIDKWFFIRYADPEYHLRVRFHLAPNADIQAIIKVINNGMQKFIDNSSVSRIQVDTYQREIERYGEISIELSETYFFYDSIFFVNILNIIKQSNNAARVRWMYILKSVDTLLDDFGLNISQKCSLMKKIDVSERMGANKQMSAKYRTLDSEIDSLLSGAREEEPWPAIQSILLQRSSIMKPIAEQILVMDKRGEFQVDLESYLASIIHMMINRICISKPNEHEYAVYDLLYRYYASKYARQKTMKQAQEI